MAGRLHQLKSEISFSIGSLQLSLRILVPFLDPGPSTPTVLGSPWKLPEKANTNQLLLTFTGLPESVTFTSLLSSAASRSNRTEREGREGGH